MESITCGNSDCKKSYSFGIALRSRSSLLIFFGAMLIWTSTLLSSVPASDIIISGYMADPTGTDGNNEYVQLIATKAIDFSLTNYSVVVAGNGNGQIAGWVTGFAITYGFNLTSESVSAGETFYVGGSKKNINGNISNSIDSAKWIRTLPTGTFPGDGLGVGNNAGVMGNGGAAADGIAVFSGRTDSLTGTSIPLDAIFYGNKVGTAQSTEGGYTVPNNDRYLTAQGTIGYGTNTYMYGEPIEGTFTRLTGTYNIGTNSWGTPRTPSSIGTLTNLSDIASAITLLNGPASVIWASGSENWNSSAPNWVNGAPASGLFKDGDHVTFNNASAGGTITIQAGGVSPASTLINNDESHPYTLQNSGNDPHGIKTGSLTKNGPGSATLISNNTYSGDTNVLAGTLSITGSHTTGANYSVSSGANLITNNVRVSNALTVNGTATINANGSTAGASKVDSLTIGAGGKLNLKDNDLVVGTAPNFNAVRTAIIAGKTNNAAVGITSDITGFGISRGFGYAMGNDPKVSSLLAGSLAGQTFDTDSVLVKFTLLGDADLDGDTDLNDLGLWSNGYTGDLGVTTSPTTFWTGGDFDYDGDTDLNDLGLWSSTYTGDFNGGPGSLVVNAPNASPEAVAILNSMGFTVVPEPSIFLLAGVGLAVLAMAQRRRDQ